MAGEAMIPVVEKLGIRRGILAVVAGYLVMTVAMMLLFAVASRGGRAGPTTNLMAGTVLLGAVAAFAGGYVTGWVAGAAEVKHALALVVAGVAVGVAYAFAPETDEPLWYQLGNLAALAVGAPIGGWLRALHARDGTAAPQTAPAGAGGPGATHEAGSHTGVDPRAAHWTSGDPSATRGTGTDPRSDLGPGPDAGAP